MSVQSELLIEIESFLRRHGGMSETTFGLLAVNDGKLVGRVREGRNMTVATIDRVKMFIANQGAIKVASAAPPKGRKHAGTSTPPAPKRAPPPKRPAAKAPAPAEPAPSKPRAKPKAAVPAKPAAPAKPKQRAKPKAGTAAEIEPHRDEAA